MGRYAYIVTFLVLTHVQGLSAAATSQGVNTVYSVIATCLGRYSAQLEHAWIVGADEATARRGRAAFDALYTALDAGPETLGLRIRAKNDHARLLQMVAFGQDQRRAALAKRQAEAQLETCRGALLN